MDTKIILIVVLGIIVTFGTVYIINDKYEDFKGEVSETFYQAGYEQGLAQIRTNLEQTVIEGCKQPMLSIADEDDAIDFFDARCLEKLSAGEGSFNAGYSKGIKDLVALSQETVDTDCKNPIIPLFSGENTVDLVDARCLESVILNLSAEVGTGN